MKLEKNDASILFSTTEIPDLFFTEYFSQSKGDYLKVYLYLNFISKYNKEVKLNDLSKKLALPISTLQDALKYWENLELITKKTTGYIVNNIQEIELHKLYSPKTSLTKEDIEKNAKNQYRAKAIETINTTFFQGIMTPSWYSDIDLWFKKYSFDEQVMYSLFQYCFQRSALHRNYVQTVADAWSKNNVKTYNDLESYYEKQEKLSVIKKSICSKLRLSRALTQFEEAYIEKWIIDYSYSLDIIDMALKKTTSKANPNFDYINKIITDWFEHKLRTPEEVQNYLSSLKQKTKNIKELEKKTNYTNYQSRQYDDFESLYANSQN